MTLNFQYKDDPLFVEFLETHTGKTAWKNDIDISMETYTEKEKSDDDDDESNDDKDDESKESKDKKEDEKNKDEEKIANKVISDLEVCMIM